MMYMLKEVRLTLVAGALFIASWAALPVSHANPLETLRLQTGFSTEEEFSNHQIEVTRALFLKDGIKVEKIGFSENSKNVLIEFGKLNPSQFENLKNRFLPASIQKNLGSRLIQFDPSRHYTLADFLEPRMKVLAGKRLMYFPKDGVDDKLEGEMGLATNCWSTATEILNFSNPEVFNSYLIDSDLALHILGDANSYLLLARTEDIAQAMSLVPTPNEELDSFLRPYDHILYFDPREENPSLVHASIYLGFGLVFQRTGNSSELDSFQVTFLTQSLHNYSLGLDSLTLEFRRLKNPQGIQSLKAMFPGFENQGVHHPAARKHGLTSSDLKTTISIDYAGKSQVIRHFEVPFLEISNGMYKIGSPFDDSLRAAISEDDF